MGFPSQSGYDYVLLNGKKCLTKKVRSLKNHITASFDERNSVENFSEFRIQIQIFDIFLCWCYYFLLCVIVYEGGRKTW
jgi:hypothetical protein